MESPQPVETPLSERIKVVRKALGLSRVKAAKKWRISAAMIRAWEEKGIVAFGTSVWGTFGTTPKSGRLFILRLWLD